MAYHEYCIPVQQKLNILAPSLIVSYIDQFDLSSCLRHPNLYRWILALCVFSFNLYLFSISVWCRGILSPGVLVVLCCYIPVTAFHGYCGLALITSDFLMWQSYMVFWSDLHISVSCSYIWLGHVWKMCNLQVGVVYPCSASLVHGLGDVVCVL